MGAANAVGVAVAGGGLSGEVLAVGGAAEIAAATAALS
jgi:hypothetical protein